MLVALRAIKDVPSLLVPDDIQVTRNSRPLAELKDQTQPLKMTAFANQRFIVCSIP
jgi:hypothetical protein